MSVLAGHKEAYGRSTASMGIMFASIALLFYCFSSAFPDLYTAWQTDEYSHGPLIPFLAIVIGWHRLAETKPVLKPDSTGCWVIAAGILFMIISRLSAFEPPAHYGFILALLGLSLAYLGRAATTVLAPSFVYLLFAIPLPRLIYVALSADMQLFSSTLGVLFLQTLGVAVFQEGNVIDLGGYQLQVVEACSGLRYLFPLMSFSFLIALLFDDKMWKRGIIFLSAIPLTIGMNALRIAIIGITVDQWGPSMADGLLHAFEGWVFFCICVFLLLTETHILAALTGKNGTRGRLRYNYFSLPRGPIVEGKFVLGRHGLIAFLICAALSLVIAFGLIDNREEIIPARQTFALFPTHFDAWEGETKSLSQEDLSVLQLTDYWLADYKSGHENAPVNLYMAYYASQRVNSSIHSPNNCLPGNGWDVENRQIVTLALGAQTVPVTRMLIRRGEEALLVYYWFQGRGRISNEQYGAKWNLLVDSTLMHRTDGALVRLTTSLSPGEKLENADRRMQDLLAHVTPVLSEYIPGK